VFWKDDFVSAFHDQTGEKPFLADVTALIVPGDDSIDVEIISVLSDPGKQEFASYLKRDKEHDLVQLMRTYYLNYAREGLEGDLPEGAA
jgi:hypothetical protein